MKNQHELLAILQIGDLNTPWPCFGMNSIIKSELMILEKMQAPGLSQNGKICDHSCTIIYKCVWGDKEVINKKYIGVYTIKDIYILYNVIIRAVKLFTNYNFTYLVLD
jgi:hypothetical protein